MEAATQPQIPVFDLGVTDSVGTPLATGDRVKVTGSATFGEGIGTVIGYLRKAENMPFEDYQIIDGTLKNVNEPSPQIRIRVLMDNGQVAPDYSASQGRVTKVDTENGGEDPVMDGPEPDAEDAPIS